MKIEVFIATHKPYDFPLHHQYIPIFAGRKLYQTNTDILGDDTGNNISALNAHFSELTALYWLWKNSTADIQGLVHYRRHFAHPRHSLSLSGKRILDVAQLPQLLTSERDIILPTPQGCGKRKIWGVLRQKKTVYENYADAHFAHDWCTMEAIIQERHPHYWQALQNVKQSKKMSFFNMFIAHKNWVNAYCTWLFDVLFALQQRVDISHYSAYQSRIFGFLAERLLNVYVAHHQNQLNVHHLNVEFLE